VADLLLSMALAIASATVTFAILAYVGVLFVESVSMNAMRLCFVDASNSSWMSATPPSGMFQDFQGRLRSWFFDLQEWKYCPKTIVNLLLSHNHQPVDRLPSWSRAREAVEIPPKPLLDFLQHRQFRLRENQGYPRPSSWLRDSDAPLSIEEPRCISDVGGGGYLG
jgi:hypothetical protein